MKNHPMRAHKAIHLTSVVRRDERYRFLDLLRTPNPSGGQHSDQWFYVNPGFCIVFVCFLFILFALRIGQRWGMSRGSQGCGNEDYTDVFVRYGNLRH
jgi:hypothetical protein